MRTRQLLPALALLAFSACGDDNLPDYSKLGGLRVLAIRAGNAGAAAEVGPTGGAVGVTVLVSDIDAGGRVLTHSMEACVDRGVAFGAEPTCDDAPDRVVVAGAATLDTTTAAPSYTTTIGGFTVNVPPGLLTGLSAAVRFNGLPYLVVFRISAPSGESVTAFKRIVITERAALNNNPAVPPLLADGATLAALPPGKVELSSVVAGESYQVTRGDGSVVDLVEEPILTWFFSDGEFKRFRTESGGLNAWTPPTTAPAGHDVVVVVVARDGRGGESWDWVSF